MVETMGGPETVDEECGVGTIEIRGLGCEGVEEGLFVAGYEWHVGSVRFGSVGVVGILHLYAFDALQKVCAII